MRGSSCLAPPHLKLPHVRLQINPCPTAQSSQQGGIQSTYFPKTFILGVNPYLSSLEQ